MERRDFLKSTAGAGVAAWTAVSASRVFGANDRLHVGLIGCGGRGTFDARLMRGTPEDIQTVATENYHDGNLDPRLKEPRNVDISALCDVYGSRLDAAKTMGAAGQDLSTTSASLLADKDIDAVIIATHGPVARADADPGLRSGQGRVSREARDVPRGRGQGHDRSGAPQQAHRAGAARSTARRTTSRRPPKWSRAERSAKCISCASGTTWSRHGDRARSPTASRPPDLNWDAWLGPAPQGAFQPRPPELPVFHGLYQRDHQRLRQPPLRFGAPDHGSGDAARRCRLRRVRFDKERAGDISTCSRPPTNTRTSS